MHPVEVRLPLFLTQLAFHVGQCFSQQRLYLCALFQACEEGSSEAMFLAVQEVELLLVRRIGGQLLVELSVVLGLNLPGEFAILLVLLRSLPLFHALHLLNPQDLLDVIGLQLHDLPPHVSHPPLVLPHLSSHLGYPCSEALGEAFAIGQSFPVEGDLVGEVVYLGPILQVLFVGVCPFSVGGDEVLQQFEGGFDVGVLLWDTLLLQCDGSPCHLVDLLHTAHHFRHKT